MHKYLKKLVDERNALTGLMQQMADTAVNDDRELTDTEAQRMREWQERAAVLDSACSEQSEYLESQRAWAKLQDKLTAQNDDTGSRAPALATRAPEAAQSWGRAFTDSPQFLNYDGTGGSGRVDVAGLFEERAAIDTSFLTVPASPFIPVPWKMTTPLLDAIGRERVSTGTVEWVTYANAFPLAGVVAEGDLKPEATFAPTPNAASLKTYAHYKAITRQALEDIPRIQSSVENTLRGGVLRKIEEDAAAVLNADATIPPVSGESLLEGIRVGIGTVQAAGYASPNAVLLNPADFAALDIAVMGATVSGPAMQTSFWGVRAVAAAAIPAGTAYVGDFKIGLTYFDRGGASVYMTDSHADFFLRNTLVILAETRGLPVVTENNALAKVTVSAGGALTATSSRGSK